MILYIGGASQGKLSLACLENEKKEEDACRCECCDRETVFTSPLLYGLHHYVRRFIYTEEEKERFLFRMKSENPGAVIICDEVGCGVVPVDRRQREYRELTGRILTELAKEADKVVRVYCGIGERIK